MAEPNDAASQTRTGAKEVSGLPLLGEDRGVGLESLRVSQSDSYLQIIRHENQLKLYAKLRSILSTIERIEKDKKNEQGGYKYASEKAIKEVFHPLFMEHGLILVPVHQELLNFTPPSGDKKSYITTVLCRFKIIDLESGAELMLEQIASGGDTLDKGTFKAVTGAIKYVLTTLFLIPTGDDPENDESKKGRQQPQARPGQRSQQDPESVITEAQGKRIFALATAGGVPVSAVKEIVGAYGYVSSKEIKVKDYDAICTEIQGAAR